MKKHLSAVALSILFLGLTVGCTPQLPVVTQFYGTSYELAKESQIYNPGAGMESGPPMGLEGSVAANVIERYEKGFEKPAPKTESYSISVGGMEVE